VTDQERLIGDEPRRFPGRIAIFSRVFPVWQGKRVQSRGEEAGLKSATVRVNGSDAYGWLKTDSAAHIEGADALAANG
jgi:hypothetical protein